MLYNYQSRVLKILAYIIDFCGHILFFRRKYFLIQREKIRKILIVKLDHLGDCFLATPFFEYLSKNLFQVKIDILCQELTKPIFEDNPYINRIVTFNYFRFWRGFGKKAGLKEFIKLIINLRREDYDLFIDSRGEPFIALLGFLINAKYRLGFEKEEFGGFFYTHPLRYSHQFHEIEKYRIILKNFGIVVEDWKPKIYLKDGERMKVENFVKSNFSKEIIALHVGSGAKSRIWPLENFVKLIDEIKKTYDYEFALLGSKSERNFISKILEIARDRRVKDLIGKFTIREVYYFLSKAKIFIGNDSALVHFAASFSLPVIELFNGAVNKNQYQAIGKNVFIFVGFDKNHHCLLDKCSYPCPHMMTIKVDDVFNLLKNFLTQ